MLSTRGSLTIEAVLNECVGRSNTCNNPSKVLPITEAQTLWLTVSSFIRNQMLLGNPITIPKFCSFWCKQKQVAVYGNTRYFVREFCFGFAQSFVTTYNLDPMVPIEDPKLKFIKLPLDIIAQESRVPADVCGLILKEVALFIGEGAFKGKSFMISFPTLADVQLKKERAFMVPAEGLVRDLFAIDSRRWPLEVRDTASATVLRPYVLGGSGNAAVLRPRSSSSSTHVSSAARARTASSSGRPPTAASSSSSPQSVVQNRPLFVTALPQNKTFAELEALPKKEIRHKPRLPGAKGRANSSSGSGNRRGQQHVDPLAPSSMMMTMGGGGDAALEEESVYDVLSPSRQMAAAMNAHHHQPQHDAMFSSQCDGHGYDDAEEEVGIGSYGYGASAQQQQQEYPRRENSSENWQALNPMPPRVNLASTTAQQQHFPLADRTVTANNNQNNVNNNNTALPHSSTASTSTATPLGVPTCCKRIKAVFPWETALPEEEGANGAATAVDENGVPRPTSSAQQRSLYGRKKMVVHPAATDSIKGLLYDNMYAQ